MEIYLLVACRCSVSKCQKRRVEAVLLVFLVSTDPATAPSSSTNTATLRLELLKTSFSDLTGLVSVFNIWSKESLLLLGRRLPCWLFVCVVVGTWAELFTEEMRERGATSVMS